MRVNGWAAAGAAIALFGAGAAVSSKWDGRRSVPAAPATSAAPAAARQDATDVITIADDVLRRAGILTHVVQRGTGVAQLRVPATVQPNAYRKVTVTPLAAGRVSRVLVKLGQAVSRGAAIAEVYSPELAEVRARYAAARADLDAGEARLKRTERLAALGSASQQELEGVRAEHARHEIEVREAAARLRLFGIDPAHIVHTSGDDSTTSVIRVTAPQGGVVIDRPASAGMSVEPSTALVTIAETSPVWIIADVYERDFARVGVGAAATVTSEAYPGLQIRGRVTYVAPDVRPETRTTQIRIEVPNHEGKLRFGMFVSVSLGAAAPADTLSIPPAAVQTIGSGTVVFIPDATAGSFRERRVTLGETRGDTIDVIAGLAPGERVVTQGSFALRAEAERQGALPADPPVSITVRITASGFEPNNVQVKTGVPLRLTFVRTTDDTCAKDVVLVDYGIRRELPLNTPVTVEFTPRKGFVFQCGMKMLSGTLTVR